MKLSQILENIDCQIYGDPGVEITGVTYDSRSLKPGYLFIALPGHNTDGRKFIDQAVSAGAAAVMSDTRIELCSTAFVVVRDPLISMAQASAAFYGHPDRKLYMVGITGTNGKTTITYFLESIFACARKPAGVMGTVNYRYGKNTFPAPNTTPQSADIYRILSEMVRSQQKSAVLEVSSHALALGRVHGIEFDCAIFTNLTRDHLDFHNTMEEYFEAKSRLFRNLKPGQKDHAKYAIINTDDPWGKKLTGIVSGAKVITYGLNPKASVRASNIRAGSRGTEFLLVTPECRRKVELEHIGRHNVYNALAAAACALGAGINTDTVIKGLSKAPHAPGRLERVEQGQNFTVVVDYAHTDDALLNVLTALRDLKPKRLITVFGCGGDRDRSKRPLMGETAAGLSDFVFVTSDNPRTEDPERIVLDIEVGIRRKHHNNYQVIINREQAIAAAVSMAQKGDIVLLAGKGHETYQIIGDKKIHFNDAEVAGKYIKEGLKAQTSSQPQFYGKPLTP